MAARELSARQRQCPQQRLPDYPTLEREVRTWTARRTARTGRVAWQFTTAGARIEPRRLFRRRTIDTLLAG